MQRPARIHVFGASGSGTTTLGAALAEELQILHIDADDYYWKLTDPPFQLKNEPDQRVAAIQKVIGEKEEWVLSGSIVSWGDSLKVKFTSALFLELDPVDRMNRLRKREQERHGDRIALGGDMHSDHAAFISWAQAYDTATGGMRCKQVHVEWMAQLLCPVLKLDSSRPVNAMIAQLTHASI